MNPWHKARMIVPVRFTNRNLQRLMQTRLTDPKESAHQANLCMEDRISTSRQAAYETAVDSPDDWGSWQEGHFNYVRNHVRLRQPLSAAFGSGEPSLRPGIEPNQHLYRVERIDWLLSDYGVEAEEVNGWIKEQRTATSFAVNHPLVDLTEYFNEERDARPAFVVFEAEFPGLGTSTNWAKQFCERCGLTHMFTGDLVTLALFCYRVQDVLDDCQLPNATLFAAPTVLDQAMSNVYFPAPRGTHGGHAVGLKPRTDCSHLATELIHARMDYRVHHWVSVDTVNEPRLPTNEVRNLRAAHLDCIHNLGSTNYGVGCV